MKKLNIFVILLSLLIIGCTDVDFGETNRNPNNPSAPLASAILTRAELNIGNTYSDTRPSLYVQYLSNEQYEDESLYVTERFDYAGYYSAITNLNKVIELNTDPETASKVINQGSNSNQIAVARLIKAYYFHHMTDRWGMIPYKTSNQGLESKFNVFNTQLDIYNSLFIEIEEAIAQIDTGIGPTGDIIFNGNMTKWKTFAYTLMMNMAMRLSKKEPALAKTYFTKALNGGVISSNQENIFYPYIASEDYDNPWEDRFTTRSDYLISKPLADALIGSGSNINPEDPRLTKFASVAEESQTYNGAPYGNSNSATTTFSKITDDIIKNQEAKGYIYTYAQILLHLAEAAEIGWITTKTAKEYTEEGITASMEQWGVDAEDINTYIENRPAFNGQKEISYQKWVALFLQGYEAWSEWRKQGENQVQLTKPSAANTSGIPNRQAYPLSAESSNEDNYKAAISIQGPDNLDTKVWWANN
ncbi:SusD/RagB family nutrient-binding outer membrane lipoprotein [Polaribacter sp. HL-MS24]|uniref:SusD/RagB family nutrient-binding outer membrane lipoprotein n=1 Tax=Polaribacter sp. HL-MS24 TaxID=3077735 RepID=UPI0029348623|nr:SusD/RagB family nutrient-binding outer membrane lipoprotein [Polaribacter sp. HL-MS24]WOC40773.1 SusD/RagB family nutrient-binding outer membrane lipoprotein [Polaribacter sp. HL-MS24]